MSAPPPKSQQFYRTLLTTAIALWTPCLVAAALDARVRRSIQDAYFWPGLVPGGYLWETNFYDERFVWVAFASLGFWTWVGVGMKRRWLGWLGAGLQGTTSAGYLMAVMHM